MEILCGQCIEEMNAIKSKIQKILLSTDVLEQRGSFKCENCGQIVMVTWRTRLTKEEQIKMKKELK